MFARKLTGFKWQETHEQETLTKYKIKKANVGGNVKRRRKKLSTFFTTGDGKLNFH